jgi:hypothetical protein
MSFLGQKKQKTSFYGMAQKKFDAIGQKKSLG